MVELAIWGDKFCYVLAVNFRSDLKPIRNCGRENARKGIIFFWLKLWFGFQKQSHLDLSARKYLRAVSKNIEKSNVEERSHYILECSEHCSTLDLTY